jgi:ABC-type multidrug transport system fused ATPase/permease subunit
VAAAVFTALPPVLLPPVIGRGLDAVLAGTDVTGWVAAVAALGLAQAAAMWLLEWLRTTLWIAAASDTLRAVTGHAARLGSDAARRFRAGEVVAVGSADVYALAGITELLGPAVGAVAAYLLVGVLLVSISPLLGVVALVGVPLAALGLAPLLGPLRRRTEAHRERVGETTTLAGDIVAGLRVLRGVGGERRFTARFAEASGRVRAAGVAAGRIDALLAGIEVLTAGLVTVAVTWLGARLAVAGELTPGELVTCYALSAYLVLPVGILGAAVHQVGEALVAAGRVAAILNLRPSLTSPAEPTPLPAGAFGLTDPESGLRCPPGRLTVVHTADPTALADRLGRFVETPVLADGVPLKTADLAEVRRRVLVARHDDVLFTGRLADEVRLGPRVALDDALWAADALDVPAGLPRGTRTVLRERARELSGGQRARLMLARALTVDPDVLVLEEPTAAVDAHTEARIAARVAELRRGRTTIVLGGGPLWAAVADKVTDEITDQVTDETTDEVVRP